MADKLIIPSWIVDYDKNNYQSSAGKAVRQLIEIIDKQAVPEGFAFSKEKIVDRINVIKIDERLSYPSANVFTNAPLALIQISLTTELHTLERIIGITPTKIPIKTKP